MCGVLSLRLMSLTASHALAKNSEIMLPAFHYFRMFGKTALIPYKVDTKMMITTMLMLAIF